MKIYMDRYEYVEDIGSGGMAKVEKAYDKLLKRHVAMKLINTDLTDDEYISRFINEAEGMAKLNIHIW